MLVLFETPAGFALFKVLNEGKLSKVEVSCRRRPSSSFGVDYSRFNFSLNVLFWG
jgi:hypothetical protein